VTQASYDVAFDVFDDGRDDVLTDKPPMLYPIDDGKLIRVAVGSRLGNLVGGAPGSG